MDMGKIKVMILLFGILFILFIILVPGSRRVVAQGELQNVVYVADDEAGMRWTIIYFTGGRGYVMDGDYYKIDYPKGAWIQIVKWGSGNYRVRSIDKTD